MDTTLGEDRPLITLRTRDGYVFKILSEFLSNTLKNVGFDFGPQGITVRGQDLTQSTYISAHLNRAHFLQYVCETPMTIGLNTVHLYRMLKNTKKKDMITFTVLAGDPQNMWIRMEPAEQMCNSGHIRTKIKIIKIPSPGAFGPAFPEGYAPEPLLIPARDFQKTTKNLTSIGREVSIALDVPHRCAIFCNGSDLYGREIRMGNWVGFSEAYVPNYRATYPTTHITQLIKMCNLSTNVMVYDGTGADGSPLPLKMAFHLGSMGVLEVYYQSTEYMHDLQIRAPPSDGREEVEDDETQ
jgi:hypothetical protein